MTSSTVEPAKVGFLRCKETTVSPEFADVTPAHYKQLLRQEHIRTGAGLLGEFGFGLVLVKEIVGDELNSPYDWIVAGVVTAVLLAVAVFTGFHAGEASRTSMPTALLWLAVPLSIGGALFAARVMHGQLGGPPPVDQNGVATTTGSSVTDNLIIALLLISVFVATTALAFHAGRRLHNPALVAMVRARQRMDEIEVQHIAEASALVAQQAQHQLTQDEIASLDERRDTQLREVYATFETAAAVARLRLAELLGDPKATENTRTAADLGPLPHGLHTRDSAGVAG